MDITDVVISSEVTYAEVNARTNERIAKLLDDIVPGVPAPMSPASVGSDEPVAMKSRRGSRKSSSKRTGRQDEEDIANAFGGEISSQCAQVQDDEDPFKDFNGIHPAAEAEGVFPAGQWTKEIDYAPLYLRPPI